jgi:hypothetical protein
MPRSPQARSITFTLPATFEPPAFDEQQMRYLVYSKEQGSGENGYVHWQGFLQLHKKRSLKVVRRDIFKTDKVYTASAVKPGAAADYCKKQDGTFLEGPYEYGHFQDEEDGAKQGVDFGGAAAKIQAKRSWSEVMNDETLHHITSKFMKWSYEVFLAKPPTPINYGDLYLWQSQLLMRLSRPTDDRTVIWVYDPEGGKGKSFLTRLLVRNFGACFIDAGIRDASVAYDYESIVVFDIAREEGAEDTIPYKTMERLKDGYMFVSKYQSGTKVFDPPTVCVFANVRPNPEKITAKRIMLYKFQKNLENKDYLELVN